MPGQPERQTPTVASTIYQRRLVAGMERSDVAYAVGVTRRMVAYWEQDRSRPRLRHAKRLASVLGGQTEDYLEVYYIDGFRQERDAG